MYTCILVSCEQTGSSLDMRYHQVNTRASSTSTHLSWTLWGRERERERERDDMYLYVHEYGYIMIHVRVEGKGEEIMTEGKGRRVHTTNGINSKRSLLWLVNTSVREKQVTIKPIKYVQYMYIYTTLQEQCMYMYSPGSRAKSSISTLQAS